MVRLRVIEPDRNAQEYETEFVPRIGERIVLEYADGMTQYFRVKDVAYFLQRRPDLQPEVLLERDSTNNPWPS
jgi:hypothetical protein